MQITTSESPSHEMINCVLDTVHNSFIGAMSSRYLSAIPPLACVAFCTVSAATFALASWVDKKIDLLGCSAKITFLVTKILASFAIAHMMLRICRYSITLHQSKELFLVSLLIGCITEAGIYLAASHLKTTTITNLL